MVGSLITKPVNRQGSVGEIVETPGFNSRGEIVNSLNIGSSHQRYCFDNTRFDPSCFGTQWFAKFIKLGQKVGSQRMAHTWAVMLKNDQIGEVIAALRRRRHDLNPPPR